MTTGNKNTIGLVDVYGYDGRRTGTASLERVAHADGFPHRTVRVWLVHGDAAWFRRAPADASPDGSKLEPCAAGHVMAGEDPVSAALRIFTDTAGIAVGPEDLVLAGLLPMPSRTPDGTLDDESAWIYVYNPEALPAGQAADGRDGFVPVSLGAYGRMLEKKETDAPDASAFACPDPLEFGMVRRALERIWAGWRG